MNIAPIQSGNTNLFILKSHMPITLHISQKIARKIKAEGIGRIPTAEDPFLDWHAHLFTHNRAQFILITNSRSLFCTFFHGAGITDENRFLQSLTDSLKNILHYINLDMIFARRIAPNLDSVRIGAMHDKRIIGSMNEQFFQAKVILDTEDTDPTDLTLKVNGVIMSLIKNRDPVEAFVRMENRD
jgi:hypothetical protein